jgi:hypothetical protein
MQMRMNSWYAALGIAGVSAVAVAAAACSSTTTVNNTPGDDASTDANTTPESDAAADTSTTAPTPDSSTTVTTDAAEEAAATCSVTLDTGSADCDTCVATSCCTALTTCDPADDAGDNDAGLSACEQLLGCISDVNSADGGTDGGAATCNPSYQSDEQTNAAAVLTCIETSCATQCPGL